MQTSQTSNVFFSNYERLPETPSKDTGRQLQARKSDKRWIFEQLPLTERPDTTAKKEVCLPLQVMPHSAREQSVRGDNADSPVGTKRTSNSHAFGVTQCENVRIKSVDVSRGELESESVEVLRDEIDATKAEQLASWRDEKGNSLLERALQGGYSAYDKSGISVEKNGEVLEFEKYDGKFYKANDATLHTLKSIHAYGEKLNEIPKINDAKLKERLLVGGGDRKATYIKDGIPITWIMRESGSRDQGRARGFQDARDTASAAIVRNYTKMLRNCHHVDKKTASDLYQIFRNSYSDPLFMSWRVNKKLVRTCWRRH